MASLRKRRAERNYRHNLFTDPSPLQTEEGLLNGQGRPGLAELRFGAVTVERSGCEALAVYNALRLRGAALSPAEVIRRAEAEGCLALDGMAGILPRGLEKLMRSVDLPFRRCDPAAVQRSADQGELPPGSAFIACIWNNRLNPFSGIHTFLVRYRAPGKWLVYNRSNSSAVPHEYPTLTDIPTLRVRARGNRIREERGVFLRLYAMENTKEENGALPRETI